MIELTKKARYWGRVGSVRLEGDHYVVSLDGHDHQVSMRSRHGPQADNLTCACGGRNCLALRAVRSYLRAGGKPLSESIPAWCPICKAPVKPDPDCWGMWSCRARGLVHYWETRFQRLRAQLAQHPNPVTDVAGTTG